MKFLYLGLLVIFNLNLSYSQQLFFCKADTSIFGDSLTIESNCPYFFGFIGQQKDSLYDVFESMNKNVRVILKIHKKKHSGKYLIILNDSTILNTCEVKKGKIHGRCIAFNNSIEPTNEITYLAYFKKGLKQGKEFYYAWGDNRYLRIIEYYRKGRLKKKIYKNKENKIIRIQVYNNDLFVKEKILIPRKNKGKWIKYN